MRRRENHTTLAYLNFAFIWGKALLAILVIMFAFIVTTHNVSPVKPPAQIEIILTWDDYSKNDVDLWVETPDGKPIYYGEREGEGGLVTLDRDDLGINDTVIINGETINAKSRDEIISIRGPVTGHYVVVANLYMDRDTERLGVGDPLPKPVNVHVQIVQLDPPNGIVFKDDQVITRDDQELFLVDFDLNSAHSIVNIDTQHPTSVMSIVAQPGTFEADTFQ